MNIQVNRFLVFNIEEVSPKNLRNNYGRSMEFVRNLYGSSMEVVMEYGMELVWNNCGISVEEVWNKYGISMEYRGIIIFEQNFDGVFGFF